MEYTENYNLKKPEGTDPVLVGDINDNSDIIDGALEDLNTGKQDALTFDEAPTASSTNPVESGGIKTALDAKADNMQTVDGETKSVNAWIAALASGGGGPSVEVKNGTDLVIAESGGDAILGDLEIGTTLHIKENDTFVDFILVEKATQNDATVVTLLRSTASDSGALTSSVSGNYSGNTADNWCVGTYYNRFSSYVKGYMVDKAISFYTDRSTHIQTKNAKCFLPSATELGVASLGEGSEVWFTNNTQRATGGNYWTRSYRAYQDNRSCYYYIQADGSTNTGYGAGNSFSSYGYRPCVAFQGTTPVKAGNFIDESGGPIIYTNTIDKLQDGNDYYKFADQRIPDTANLADGNYKLRVSMASGVPTFSWEADT